MKLSLESSNFEPKEGPSFSLCLLFAFFGFCGLSFWSREQVLEKVGGPFDLVVYLMGHILMDMH